MIDDPDELSRIRRGLARLRERSTIEVGGRPGAVVDYAEGRAVLPPADMVEVDVHGMGRVLIRPSGTEPKLKIYAESHMDASDTREAANAAAAAIADEVVALVQTSGE